MELALTGLWAESVLRVAVVVLRGPTPAVPVVAALCGAAVINRPLEREGELAGRTVGVAPQGKQHCGNTFRRLLGIGRMAWYLLYTVHTHVLLKLYVSF